MVRTLIVTFWSFLPLCFISSHWHVQCVISGQMKRNKVLDTHFFKSPNSFLHRTVTLLFTLLMFN